MRSYLLVLDTDLLALDDKLGQEPINYLVEQREQDQFEVVVLSLAGQTKLSSQNSSSVAPPAASSLRPSPR